MRCVGVLPTASLLPSPSFALCPAAAASLVPPVSFRSTSASLCRWCFISHLNFIASFGARSPAIIITNSIYFFLFVDCAINGLTKVGQLY